jgi:hypothetical protein
MRRVDFDSKRIHKFFPERKRNAALVDATALLSMRIRLQRVVAVKLMLSFLLNFLLGQLASVT